MFSYKRLLLCSTILFLFTIASSSFAVTVSIPEGITAPSGSTVQIPINVDDATGIGGFQFTVTFDSTVLQAIETVAGSLTAGWSLTPAITTGQIEIGGFDFSLQGLSGGSGSLVLINFNVTGDLGDTTVVEFTSATLSNTLGVVFDPAPTTDNGSVTVEGAETHYSVSGTISGDVQTGTIYIGIFTSSDSSGDPFRYDDIATPGPYTINDVPPGEYWAYAFRDAIISNGELDPNEPVGRYTNNPFTVDAANVGNIDITLTEPPVTREVSIPVDLAGAPDSVVDIPINIDNCVGISEFQFVIDYDSTILEYAGIAKGTLLPDIWMADAAEFSAGKVEIDGKHTNFGQLAGGSGSLAILKLRIKGDAVIEDTSDLVFSSTKPVDPVNFLKDSQGGLINANYTNGLLTVSPSFTLELKAGGWNLVSFPVEPTITTPTDLIPNLISIFEWEQGYRTPLALHAKKGYWILVTQDTSFNVEGTVPGTTTVSLVEGWNLVGPVEDALRPEENIISVFGWGTLPAGGYNSINIGANCVKGKGYWILPMMALDIW